MDDHITQAKHEQRDLDNRRLHVWRGEEISP
jgi:hypothetical protein